VKGGGCVRGETPASSVIVQLLALIKEVSIERARGLHISDTQFYNNTHTRSRSQQLGSDEIRIVAVTILCGIYCIRIEKNRIE
jgi:hypothetical protein